MSQAQIIVIDKTISQSYQHYVLRLQFTKKQDVSHPANIHFIRQKELKGLEHAIYCAKSLVGNEQTRTRPVLARVHCVTQKKTKLGQNRTFDAKDLNIKVSLRRAETYQRGTEKTWRQPLRNFREFMRGKNLSEN